MARSMIARPWSRRCSTTTRFATRWRSPASTRSTGPALRRRSPIISLPRSRSAVTASARSHSPFRPAISGIYFAGYVAKRMGLTVERLTVASNENDILPRTMASGVYEKRGVVATTSPSMDIQVSSNFERYLFEAQSRDAALIRGQMALLAQSGRFEVKRRTAVGWPGILQPAAPAKQRWQLAFARRWRQAGYVLEPHTACGLIASRKQSTVTIERSGNCSRNRPSLPNSPRR